MGKNLKMNHLRGRLATRSLLAVSLVATLAAYGCTTNQNLGNGVPTRNGGELRSAPTSGVTSGGERTSPQPMTSSYTRAEVLPRVTPRTQSRADRAAAIMADNQPLRGRYLGPADPGPGGRAYVSDGRTGNFVNPALLTNPQLTVNSSISSSPVPGINTGVPSTSVVTGGFAGGATTNVGTGFTADATVGGATTTAAAATDALPAGVFAAGARPTLTETISGNPTVTAASMGAGRNGVVAGTVTTNATAARSGTAATTGTTITSANAADTVATGAVRIVRGANGRATITNTATTTNSGRQ